MTTLMTPETDHDLRYAWYVVGVLMLAAVVSFIDRQILSLLIEPIRRDLKISDTQVSLLAGLAFSLFYTVVGIPIARLADSSNRRNIIAVGILVWSVMTAFCGLARNFPQLFIARVGVGVGEAALSPPAFSMIADYFPREKLGRAVAVFSLGVYMGVGLALIIGGAVVNMLSGPERLVLPIIGEVFAWQVAFLVVGFPGLLVVTLMMSVKEPRRRGGDDGKPAQAMPIKEVVAFLRRNQRTLVCHFIGFSLIGLVGVGFLVWVPTFFIRSFGWTAGDSGLAYGTIILVFATAGVYAGGALADYLSARGHGDATLRAGVYAALLSVPFCIATPLMPTAELALASLAATSFTLAMPQALQAAALQVIAPANLRAQLTAIYYLVANFTAVGLGPTVVAVITDYIFVDPLALRYSLVIVGAVIAPISAVFMGAGLKAFRSSVAAVNPQGPTV